MGPRRFTLVELLVVVVILVILAHFVLASGLGSHRESGRRSRCLSNQKQIMLGAIMFAGAHGERFPLEASFDEAGDGGASQYLHRGVAIAPAFRGRPVVDFNPDAAPIDYGGLTGFGGREPRSAQATVVFFNRLYADGGRGGQGIIADAKVFICPNMPGPENLPVDEQVFGVKNAPSYGINHRIRGGSRSVPNVIVSGDLARVGIRTKPKSLADEPDADEARGIFHGGQGFNFGYNDGHTKWFRTADPGRGVPDSCDNDDIFRSTGNGRDGREPTEDIAFY